MPPCGFKEICNSINLDSNEIGDALAGLFSPVAFVWLVIAALMQRQELKLQREELKQQRKATKKMAKAQTRSVEIQDHQFAFLLNEATNNKLPKISIRIAGVNLRTGSIIYTFSVSILQESPEKELTFLRAWLMRGDQKIVGEGEWGKTYGVNASFNFLATLEAADPLTSYSLILEYRNTKGITYSQSFILDGNEKDYHLINCNLTSSSIVFPPP